MRKRSVTALQFIFLGVMVTFGSFIVISLMTVMKYIAQMKLSG
jgi:hypothetical protein